MGNIIHPHRRDNVKPEQTLATVRAAGIFKARRNETNVRKSKTSEQIEEIVKWKFRRKSDVFGYLPMGRLASIDESQEQNADSSEKDVLKFVRR